MDRANSSSEQQALTLQQALDLAVQHHTSGRFPEATDIYQKILQTDPNQPIALHLLGVIFHEVGENIQAVDLIRKAIDIKPDYAEAHNNLGTALQDLGELEAAVTSYHNALTIKFDYAETHSNLGLALKEMGKLEAAVDSFNKALTIKQDYAEVHSNLGGALQELGKLEDAVASYRRALSINPGLVEAHKHLISSLKELGKIYEKQQLRDDKQFSERLDFFYAYLQTLGVLNSKVEEVVNGRREAIPLLTNSFLHWFETKIWSRMNLLELGSGNSTLYFSRFFKQVSSYENNEKWYKASEPKIPKNVNYIYAHPIRSALEEEDTEKFDVILLDAAENRAKLARIILKSSFSGLIFFDNSEWYRQSISILSEAGFAEIPFFGITPVQNKVSCTSVLVKSENLVNWFTSDWARLPDLARPLNKFNSWDNENSKE